MMVKCSVHDIFLRPASFHSTIFSQQFGLLYRERNASYICPQPTVQSLSAAMESVDYMYKILTHMAENSPVQISQCFHLEMKVVFVFMGDLSHIYFKFLDYYSLYKSIEDSGLKKGEYTIVRIPKSPNLKKLYLFESFEKILFPEVQSITHFVTSFCIKKAIFVPYAYYTAPFRCKRDAHLVPYCTQCTGDKYNKPYISFRAKVLKACGLSDSVTRETRQLQLC